MSLNNVAVKKATDRYNEVVNEDLLISLVSTTEVEIIKELREAFKKLGVDEIVAILDKYKYYPDNEVSDDLLEWNTNFNEDYYEDDKEGRSGRTVSFTRPRIFMRIQEGLYLLDFIYHIGKHEDFDNEEDRYVYYITLNETPEDVKKVPVYANKRFKYFNQDDRDSDFIRLNNIIESDDNTRIL